MGLKNASIGFSVLVLTTIISYCIYIVYKLTTGDLILNIFYYILLSVLTLACLFTLYMLCNLIGNVMSIYLIRRRK